MLPPVTKTKDGKSSQKPLEFGLERLQTSEKKIEGLRVKREYIKFLQDQAKFWHTDLF